MRERALPLALAAVFLVLGSFVLELPGVQADEALFAGVLFQPKVEPVNARLLFFRFPAMVFPYIGTLKTGIYALVWRFFEPSPASVHFLAVVLGALSIYIFARLLQRLRQPLWAAVLLATDATYLFTIRCDWGPVALQHLLAISGVYAVVRYAQTEHLKWVALAGFLFGLGFWDKITFLWILFALAAGLLATARNLLKVKPIAIGAGSFLAGCYPLLVYNWKTNGNSFKGNAVLDSPAAWRKTEVLWGALGDLNVFNAGREHALPPAGTYLFDFTWPLLPWLFAAGLLGAPWLWKSFFYRFYLVAMIAGYGYMFSLQNAGGGAHHVVLLWPLPHLIASSLPLRRWMLGLVVAANLLQVNHYYAQIVRREVSVEWSDASTRLAVRLRDDPGTYRVLDWGIFDTLHLLTKGKTDLYYGPGPGGKYITHVPKLTFQPHDLELIPEETITDSAGRPVFVISRRAPDEGK
jgi:4-amino-4-deoxy-L-arabinose transferase-like glycosyltransferase